MIPPLEAGGDVRLGGNGRGVDLKGLTDIYSIDALTLVRDHLFSIIGVSGAGASVSGSSPMASVVQIALFQAGQVYAMSALFGYYVRRVDARYQLDKLAGSFGAFGEDPAAAATADVAA